MGLPTERGAVGIVFAVALVMLLGLVALVVDIGRFWTVKGELQNAAALAGVRDLDGTAAHPIVGYVDMKLTGATFSPNKSVTAAIDCTHSGERPPAGDFYGYKSTAVYLVK